MTKRGRKRTPPRPMTEAEVQAKRDAVASGKITPIVDPATLKVTADLSHIGQPITAEPVGKLTVIRPRRGPIRTGLRRRGR